MSKNKDIVCTGHVEVSHRDLGLNRLVETRSYIVLIIEATREILSFYQISLLEDQFIFKRYWAKLNSYGMGGNLLLSYYLKHPVDGTRGSTIAYWLLARGP